MQGSPLCTGGIAAQSRTCLFRRAPDLLPDSMAHLDDHLPFIQVVLGVLQSTHHTCEDLSILGLGVHIMKNMLVELLPADICSCTSVPDAAEAAACCVWSNPVLKQHV